MRASSAGLNDGADGSGVLMAARWRCECEDVRLSRIGAALTAVKREALA
jgi:hypothetical protein